MHGLIFEGFRSFLAERAGAVVDRVFADSVPYDRSQAYADDEFSELVDRAAENLGVTRHEVLLDFGSFAARRVFVELFPAYYAESGGTQAFLLAVEDRIHALVRRAVPDAQPPRLHVAPFGSSGVAITYTSERRLCALLEGLVQGAAEHYGERVAIQQPQCMLRGDLACAFFVEISPDAGQNPRG